MFLFPWQGLLSAVDSCFKAVPASEHKSLALKWVGSGDEFINFDLITDPVLLTKYNAMVHKAHQLKRAQVNTALLWIELTFIARHINARL